MRGPEPLGTAIGRALKGLRLDDRMREHRAMALWPDVVGEVTAAKTRPLWVNRGVMTVGVASSPWAHQLELLKAKLLATIAGRVGEGVITDLRWRVGPADTLPEPPQGGQRRASRPRAAGPEAPPLSAEARASIARAVAAIPDGALAERIARTLESQARRRARQALAGWVPCKRCGVLHDPAPDAAPAFRADAPDLPAGVVLCPACRMALAAFLG